MQLWCDYFNLFLFCLLEWATFFSSLLQEYTASHWIVWISLKSVSSRCRIIEIECQRGSSYCVLLCGCCYYCSCHNEYVSHSFSINPSNMQILCVFVFDLATFFYCRCICRSQCVFCFFVVVAYIYLVSLSIFHMNLLVLFCFVPVARG